MSGLSLTGAGQVKANLRKFERNLSQRKKNSQRRIMKKVLLEAQMNVPIDQGDLYDSGRIVESEKGNSVTVTFGGPGIPQAISVHEHPSQFSPPSWQAAEAAGRPVRFNPAPRGPKYLEKAFMSQADRALKELGEDLQVDRL